MGPLMTVDLEAEFQRLDEATQIWNKPQFTVAEVCKITGATPKALEHFLTPSRGMVRLMGDWVNPGTGKRRIFTGGQVLQIAAAYAMKDIGFPQRFSIPLADHVVGRAKAIQIGLADRIKVSIITYPMANGDWALIPVYEGMDVQPKLPVAFHVLDVDRLVHQVHDQLQAIVAGEDIPDFTVPDIAPEPNPYSPASNFFRAWEKDDAGNWLLVGLTLDETRDYMDLHGWRLAGDELEYEDRPHLNFEDRERYLALNSKHEEARLQLITGAFVD